MRDQLFFMRFFGRGLEDRSQDRLALSRNVGERLTLPWDLERAMLPRGIPLFVDYDDAVFHRYDLQRSAAVRRLVSATAAWAQRVEIVPTVLDLKAYTRRPEPFSENTLTIVWIGTPSTLTEYMAPRMLHLTNAAEAAGARIVAVGAGRSAAAHPQFDNLPWTQESEVARIHEMDIRILLRTDTPWARGNCGYKLIQYVACGIPFIASPVGVNAEIVEHGVNGLLASSDPDSEEALQTLLRDPALRARMGEEGSRKVERDYSLQVWGPRVAQMLRDVADKGKSR